MRGKHKTLWVSALSVLGLLIGASMGWSSSQEQARRLKQTGAILPLETILSKARAVYPGQVIEMEFERERGRYFYDLDVVGDDGMVWELELDAQTGEILERDRSE